MESSSIRPDRSLHGDGVVARAAHRYTGQFRVSLQPEGTDILAVLTPLAGGEAPADLIKADGRHASVPSTVLNEGRFQKDHGLPITGTITTQSLNALGVRLWRMEVNPSPFSAPLRRYFAMRILYMLESMPLHDTVRPRPGMITGKILITMHENTLTGAD